MKCQPLNFKGTEGVVGLSQWFEKMESVFHISGCAVENQVKFATCTLLGAALTWWNGHVRTLGHDAAYAMTWEILKKKLTNKYCPKGEIKKLEIELWNLKVKGNDVGGYTQRFQELALMCTKFLSDETEKVDKYISGLPDNIHGNAQQQLLKKQNVVQAYDVGTGEKKPYGGSKPLCPKCNYHHDGECAPKCTNCKKVGHLTKECWHPINAITCYECENQGHYRSDCPVLKNQGTEARGMVYALGGGETDQDINNMKDDINA
ncbi:reverse transcriptase domain-containing protein [Tanacetum coccineum]